MISWEGPVEAAEKYALLIGIDEYESAQIPDLRGAVNDIKLMRKH